MMCFDMMVKKLGSLVLCCAYSTNSASIVLPLRYCVGTPPLRYLSQQAAWQARSG
jgi:hypothetical protein